MEHKKVLRRPVEVSHIIWYVIYDLVCHCRGCSFLCGGNLNWLDHTWEAYETGNYRVTLKKLGEKLKFLNTAELNEMEIVFIPGHIYTAESD